MMDIQEKARVLRSAIAALISEFEKSTGVYVDSIGIHSIDVTTSDSVTTEHIRTVVIELKSPPGVGVT